MSDFEFCPHCGENLGSNEYRYCPHCGAGILVGASNCTACGAAVVPTGRLSTGPVGQAVGNVEYMGFWIRVAALLLDWIILLVVQVIISIVTGPIIALIAGVMYNVLFIAFKGQTPGKMAAGIQVINGQGEVPRFGRALLREIVGKFVSGIVIGLGYLWVGWDPEKRGWHDHIGGTYVIRKTPGR